MKRWLRFWQLSPPEKSLVLRALVLTPAVGVGLRLGGTARTAATLHRLQRRSPHRRLQLSPDAAARLVYASANSLGATCLQRALVLCHLLLCSRVPAELRLGVRKDAHGEFAAHAWVEFEGRALAETTDPHAHYAVLPGADGGLGFTRN